MPKFKSDTITIKINPKMKSEIESIALENELTVSEYIRYLLQKEIDKRDIKNKQENS